MRLSRRRGQVTHVLLTRSPLIQDPQKQAPSPFDLHVLSTPPAFVLSQDQTLQTKPTKPQPTPHNKHGTSQSNSQNSPENQTRPHPTPNHNSQKPGKPKQNKPQKPHTTNKSPPCAAPRTKWHKKHDTLSSSQTTHPARSQSSFVGLTLPWRATPLI